MEAPPLAPLNHDAINLRFNSWIKQKCQEQDKAFLITNQLRLHFPHDVTFPDGVTLDLAKLNIFPIDRALSLLPLVRRIRIAAELMGGLPQAARTLHEEVQPSPLPLLSKREVQEVEGFELALQELTGGVVTIYQMDIFRVLRMFLFAKIGRCLQRDKVLAVRLPDPAVKDQTMKSIIVHCRSLLLEMFALAGSFEDLSKLDEAVNFAEQVTKLLAYLPTTLAEQNSGSEWEQVQDDLDFIRTCMEIFEKALKKPCLFLPLMLVRVHTIAIDSMAEVDRGEINIAACSWLHDFTLACEIQRESSFPSIIKINKNNGRFKKLYRALESRSDTLWQQTRDITLKVSSLLKDLRTFEKLTLVDKREGRSMLESLKTTRNQLNIPIRAFDACYHQFKNDVKKVHPSPHRNFSILFNEIMVPLSCQYFLMAAIFETVDSKRRLYQDFYRVIDRIMQPCPFRQHHESLLDLLQWQVREQFLKVHTQFSADQTLVDTVGECQARLDRLLASVRSLVVTQNELPDDHKITEAHEAHQLWADLKQMRASAKNPNVDLLLEYYQEIASLLGRFFLMSGWQNIFWVNPSALEKIEPDLERRFYLELFVSCRNMVLIPHSDSFIQLMSPELTKDDEPFFTDLMRLQEDFKDLSKIRNEILKQETPTLENYPSQARHLIALMTKFAQEIEERTRELQLSISLHLAKRESPVLEDLHVNLQNFNLTIQSLFFSPAQSLIAHLHREELLSDGGMKTQKSRKRVLETASRRPRTQESARKHVIQTPQTRHEREAIAPPTPIWISFQERYQELFQHLAARELTESQQACLQNLRGNLSLLQDLVATVELHGERPYFIIEANLALMVQMEQTLALLNLSPSPEDDEDYTKIYRQMGLESDGCQHAPHLRLTHSIHPSHLTFMQEREWVIPISSRYVGSRRDRLTEDVKRALNLSKAPLAVVSAAKMRYRTGMHADLNAGLKACLALLEKEKLAPVFFDEKPIPQKELEFLLAATSADENDWDNLMHGCLSRFETTLARIQQHRMTIFHRAVPDASLNGEQREGTIQLALGDLEMTLRLSRDLLQGDLDPSQGMISAKQAWLRQAVALERVLLIVLSHLPAEESDSHVLWAESHRRPERYSHHLVSYTQKLREHLPENLGHQLLEETENLAKDVEPYLKTLYRYHAAPACPAKERQEKIEGLMRLRRQLINKLTDWNENDKDHLDKLLKASQLQYRLPLLDQHILNTVRKEAMLPLLETLDLAEDWLRVYKQLLTEKLSLKA